MKYVLLCSTAIIFAAPTAAMAGDQPSPAAASSDGGPTDIIVTGTRQSGMRAEDSAAPIQLVGQQAFQNVGQQDLTQVLAQSLPSLNFQGFGGDTANLTLSAALRGISPNDTMVLINGKRRHTTANLAVLGGSPYSGSATTDLSFVPVSSIARIEVLQDGAAAQYGSDAIAGVVNIILKDANHGGTFNVDGGQNYENGGSTVSTGLNMGFKLGQNGFINVTGEYKYHDHTQHGTCDRRLFDSSCNLLGSDSAVDVAGVKANSKYPYVNTINGDAQYSLYNLSFNSGYDISSDMHAYAFGSYGNRVAKSYENYRVPSKIVGTTSTGTTVYPLATGFQPLENVREEDFSLTGGLKGVVSQWNYDLSLTYGRDSATLYTLNSANAGLYAAEQSTSATALTGLQRNFYDGRLTNSEWVADFDLTRDFDVGLTKPATLAMGAEYRNGTYSIANGEYASYAYGGGQSYPGFAPTDAGSYGRTNWAGYVDAAFDPVKSLHVDLAGRYETYSDFGSVWTGKANARYDFSPAFGVRGTVSNGFRAPTLAEEYYSSVNVGPGTTFGQLPPNSAAAQTLGFSKLKPEKSTNFSAGFVLHPLPKLMITVDAYQIKIRDRIVASGNIFGSVGTTVISQSVLDALHSRGVSTADATSYSGINIFTNGVDTRTRGIEATASYASDFAEVGHIDWSLGFNYNKTDITRIAAVPTQVNDGSVNTALLTQYAKDGLTTATPRVKVIGNILLTHGKWTVNLRETVYGATSQHDSPDGTGEGSSAQLVKIGATGITDLNIGYKFTKGLRLDVGANNLFDKQAPTYPLAAGGARPLDGNVYRSPVSFTPWGINGGYWYAKATLNF